MPETYKEQQIESLFEPKTSDDRTIVHLFKAVDEITTNHKGDYEFIALHAQLSGFVIAVAVDGESTFDPQFVKEVSDRYGEEFLAGFHGEQEG